MTTTAEDLTLAEYPFRGVKRSIGAVISALLITTIAWGIWAGIAHRRLQARLDSIAEMHQSFLTPNLSGKTTAPPAIDGVDWKPLVLDVPLTPLAPDAVDQIKSTIAKLLDTSKVDRINVHFADQMRESDFAWLRDQRKQSWLLAPMVDLAEDFVLEQRAVDRFAAATPSVPAARVVYQSHPTAMTRQYQCPSSRDPVLGIYTNSFETMEQSLTHSWNAIADRRAAALALAIRLYRADRGRWPGQAVDLIPQYISAIPQDPLMGEPVGYVVLKHALPDHGPDRGDRPMVYFNLPTDLGTAKPSDHPVYSWNDSSAQWRDLMWWGPETNGFGPPGMPGMPPMR